MICKATTKDASIVAQLATKLWSHHTIAEMTAEFEEMLQKQDIAVFLLSADDHAIGFAQCGLRHDYVEGTNTSPVGYLEGVFVDAPYRKHGYAKVLLAACEAWAKEQGCTEFASDCELHNNDSLQFHLNVGFEEANRIICFRKIL